MRNHFSLTEANVLYGFATLLLVMVSFISANVSFIFYAFMAEVMVFIGPLIFMAKYMDIDLRKSLKLKSMTADQWKYSALFALSMVPVSLFISILSSMLFEGFGKSVDNGIPIAGDMNELFLQIIVIGLVTGLSEELFFRGMFFTALESRIKDSNKSIVIVAFLFAVMHFDVQNFLNPLFLGIIFGLVVRKTGSVFSSVIGHFTINAAVVILVYIFSSSPVAEQAVSSVEMMNSLMFYGGFAVLSSGFGYLFYRRLGTAQSEATIEIEREPMEEGRSGVPRLYKEFSFLIPMGVVLFYCVVAMFVYSHS